MRGDQGYCVIFKLKLHAAPLPLRMAFNCQEKLSKLRVLSIQ